MSEATIYGGLTTVRAIDFFLRAKQRMDGGESVTTIVSDELRQRRILGYGRPLSSMDERLPWLIERANTLGLDHGPHLRLAFEVEQELVARKPLLRMNFAGLTAALGADLGFSARDFHLFRVPVFLAGMMPCFLEHATNKEGTLFPLACTDIQYEGLAQRSWPVNT